MAYDIEHSWDCPGCKREHEMTFEVRISGGYSASQYTNYGWSPPEYPEAEILTEFPAKCEKDWDEDEDAGCGHVYDEKFVDAQYEEIEKRAFERANDYDPPESDYDY